MSAAAFCLLFAILAGQATRYVWGHQRLVELRSGRFHRLIGPGLVMRASAFSRQPRIQLGDTGILRAPGVAAFQGIELPVQVDPHVRVGRLLRIVSFDGAGGHPAVVAQLLDEQTLNIE